MALTPEQIAALLPSLPPDVLAEVSAVVTSATTAPKYSVGAALVVVNVTETAQGHSPLLGADLALGDAVVVVEVDPEAEPDAAETGLSPFTYSVRDFYGQTWWVDESALAPYFPTAGVAAGVAA